MTATASDRGQELHRRALRLAYFIIVWDVVEGVVAVTAGVLANSIALIGFGLDSGIEVFAASVVVWQLRGSGEARESTVLRLIALTFFALAAYVAFNSIGDLLAEDRAGESLLGIALNVVALLVMVPVAVAQRRTGRALGSEVDIAQSEETWISNYLSISLLLGLGANALFGWWCADPAVALLIAGVAAWEGLEAWREAQEHGD